MGWRDHIRMSHDAVGVSHMQHVDVPKAHEGVGNALRSAFTPPPARDLPPDLAALLAKLN